MLFVFDKEHLQKGNLTATKVIPQNDKDQSGHDSDSCYEFNTCRTEFLFVSHLFTCSSMYNVCTRKSVLFDCKSLEDQASLVSFQRCRP